MRRLPSGNVTFVFTDVEGSTRLQARLGSRARELIDAQASVIIGTIEEAGGFFVDRTGDGLLLAFAEPVQAIEACLAAQLALLRHPWPADARVLVRMGVHSGPAEPYDDNYNALPVSQGARVADTAHGGQIVVSEATAALAEGLPVPSTLVPLGRYRVRDFDRPIALFEARHPDLPGVASEVRAPRLLDEVIPARRTSMVGRERELGALETSLAQNRIVTVAGMSGMGKTRLAVELAATRPNAWFVNLAAAGDGAAVPAAIAAAVGVSARPGADPLEAVIERFGKSEALLVLDNCEHVLDAAALAADRILGGAPGVRVLATSQAPLEVSGEHVMRLDPLDLPPESVDVSLEEVLSSDSARLFIERAKAADTGFDYDASDAPAIARLCRALDGLPLALELAATRVRALGLRELAERIDDRFAVLSGSRRGPARHATLRAAIEWSYGLLEEPTRAILRRVSVFRGSFTIGDARTVSDDPALEELITLVDRGLLQREAETMPVRFRLLESIRAFAAEELVNAGEDDRTRERHLGLCIDLARSGAITAPYVGDVDATLAWAAGDPSRVAAACDLAELIVPRPGAVPLDLLAARTRELQRGDLIEADRVRALQVAAEVALRVGSPDREELTLALVDAAKRSGTGMARALLLAGTAQATHGRFSQALAILEEAAVHADDEEEEGTRLQIDLRATSVQLECGQHDVIEPFQDVVSAMRARRDPSLPVALNNLAIAYERSGRLEESSAVHAEALDLRRATGDTMGEVTTLVNLASVLVRSRRFVDARERLREAIAHPSVRQNLLRVAAICGTVGELLTAEGERPLDAARLLGAHQRIREMHGRARDTEDDAQYQPVVSTLIAALGDAAYQDAFRDGYGMEAEEALDLVSSVLARERQP